jgi:coenzyme F420-reducing hydrogenase gamma subunit
MQSSTLQNLINQYIQCHGQGGLAEHITTILQQERDIKNKMYKLSERIKQENEIYKNIVKALDIELGTIQIDCPHWEVTYHGDPSGGSDSYNECGLCHKQW